MIRHDNVYGNFDRLAKPAPTCSDRLLDPEVKVATSTPIADPAADYAWDLFRKADQLRRVAADYGMTMMKGATAETATVAGFILSPVGQQIFIDARFQSP